MIVILSLLGFHVWINILGVTTYKWILDRREAQDNREYEREKAARAVEMANIKKQREQVEFDCFA